MKKIVVTGASGMIGSELIRIASNNGIKCIAIVRENSKKLSNIEINDNVEVLNCDLQNISQLQNKFTDADVFYHFAWDGVFGNDRNNVKSQVANIQYSLEAIDLAASLGCKKFVFAGSQAEFGIATEALTCDTIEKPITPYGIAKNIISNLGAIYANQLGLKFVSGRVLSAYGEKDNQYTLVSTLIKKIKNNEPMDLSDGNQIWDYIYQEDVAMAFLQLGYFGKNKKKYPIGSGVGISLREYIEKIKAMFPGYTSKLNFGVIPSGANSVRFLKADISELKKDTHFEVKYDFDSGIAKTIKNFKY